MKYIQIGPSKYKLLKHEKGPDTPRGTCDNQISEISLREKMPKDMEAEVLLHEILHAICYTYTLYEDLPNNMQEKVVTTLSTGLASTFVQNPKLLTYFSKAFK